MIPERPISEGYIGLSRVPPDCEPTPSDQRPYEAGYDDDEAQIREPPKPFSETKAYRFVRALVVVVGAYTLGFALGFIAGGRAL